MKKFWMSSLILLIFLGGCKKKKMVKERMCARIDFERIVSLFPKNVTQVDDLLLSSKSLMDAAIESIAQVQACMRNYQNTVLVYEQAYFQFIVNLSVLRVLAMLSNDENIIISSQKAVNDLQNYQATVLISNKILYQAFLEYLQLGSDNYKKSVSVQYFLNHMIQNFEHVGVKLDDLEGAHLEDLKRDINNVSAEFVSNIVNEKNSFSVSSCDLDGLSDQFINSLQKDSLDNCIVPINSETFALIMKNCLVESTRKTCFMLFSQRASKLNQKALTGLLSKRHEMANLLKYPNFASYQLHGLMAKTPKRAEKFLLGMIKDLQPYADKDFEKIVDFGLAPSINLIDGNLLKPWDVALARAWYQKHMFDLSQDEISKYFSLSQVIPSFLQQFNRVFHIEFEPQKTEGLWADGLQCYRIRSLKHQSVLGYMILDLYKRPLKKIIPSTPEAMRASAIAPGNVGQSHMMIVPSIRDDCSISCVGSSVVVTNFVEPTHDCPTLLTLDEVMETFHEMGHALHALFGATRFTQFSGTQVVQDFMEAPCKMLECWFDKPELWTSISSDYKTGDTMPKDMIEKIIASLKFSRPQSMLNQLFLGLMSLRLHLQDQDDLEGKEIHSMVEKLYKKTFKHIAYDSDCYFETSFMFLAGDFGASYYMYPWTSVIAADLFDKAYQRGLFEYETGNDYVTEVLSPGGLRSPYEMVGRFLGRSFNNKSFLKTL